MIGKSFLKDQGKILFAGIGLAASAVAIKNVFDNPSRKYHGNVGQEYDAWTSEGILEHYWGDNIHLGYYSEKEQALGYTKKDFKKAKVDFIDEMFRFSGSQSPRAVLDVGCGFGGSSRHLARKFPDSTIIGITLSAEQVKRARELAAEQGLTNVHFFVMDALYMDGSTPQNSEQKADVSFPPPSNIPALITELYTSCPSRTLSPLSSSAPDSSASDSSASPPPPRASPPAMSLPAETFDLVWACESGEHMPDKRRFVSQMSRVLRPAGNLVIACWCQRDSSAPHSPPITAQEQKELDFLYHEWAHPFFVSKEAFGRMLSEMGKEEGGGGDEGAEPGTAGKGADGTFKNIQIQNWTRFTLPTWHHSILVGVWDPWIVLSKGPRIWYKTLREVVMIQRMHKAFAKGLMEYGMISAVKAEKEGK
nr:putative tocopherol o-methyltransferase, chloroplastic (VTE4) [Polytomella parva]